MILFSVKIAEKHREKLRTAFPNERFVFCDSVVEAAEHLADAEVLATYGGEVTEGLFEKAPNLKWIAGLSAGVDGFPFKEIEKREILLTNARGIHEIQMSEYAIAMLLQVSRNSKTLIENERQGIWDQGVRIQEITGKTMVLLGTGAIGRETARLAKAFRMQTIGVSRSGRATEYFDQVVQTTDLLQVLPQADFIVSVLPSTPETKQMLWYEHFKAMKETAVFLNMGRGDLLVEDDLLRALREEELAHAVLDVFAEEPLHAAHPFWRQQNITITPHNAGLTPEYMRRAIELFSKNLTVYVNNGTEFVNEIDLTQGY